MFPSAKFRNLCVPFVCCCYTICKPNESSHRTHTHTHTHHRSSPCLIRAKHRVTVRLAVIGQRQSKYANKDHNEHCGQAFGDYIGCSMDIMAESWAPPQPSAKHLTTCDHEKSVHCATLFDGRHSIT